MTISGLDIGPESVTDPSPRQNISDLYAEVELRAMADAQGKAHLESDIS